MRRIVLDTNCLLAILPSRSKYHKVWTDFLENRLEICVSSEILAEYEEIISRKTNSTFANLVINTLLNKENLIRINPTYRFNLINIDPDDNKFTDCAVCGQAECIVSNDRHFKVLKEIFFPPITLFTLQEFCEEL